MLKPKMLLRLIVVLFLSICLHDNLWAQPDDQDEPVENGGPGGGGPGDPDAIPLDTNIFVFVAVGVGYGLKKIYDVKQQKNKPSNSISI